MSIDPSKITSEAEGIKPGDIVLHKPSGEKWRVAAVSPDGRELSPEGWPESIADVADCDLIEACSAEKSEEMTSRALALGGSDVRGRWARAYLEGKA